MAEKILYTKFSNDRASQFRIFTQIIEVDGKKIIRKSAADPDAQLHVQKMLEHEKSLSKLFDGTRFKVNKTLDSREKSIDFEFVEGVGYDHCLDAFLINKDIDGFKKEIGAFFDELDKIATTEFHATEMSDEIFGKEAFVEGEKAIPVGDIDLIFQNVIVSDDGAWNVIDYEWTFAFAIPVRYLKWRALFNFFAPEYRRANFDYASVAKEFSLDGLEEKFLLLEIDAFRKYVKDGTFSNYCKENKKGMINPFVELSNKSAHIEQLLQIERDLSNKIRQLDVDLSKHAENEENLICELRNKNGHIDLLLQNERNLQNEIASLKNSTSWRITEPCRLAGRLARKIYHLLVPHKLRTAFWLLRHQGPKGIFQRIKEKRAQKLECSYRPALVGKISYKKRPLPVFDDILVSIIIPVFNQFDYTYKCILSILNTVKDIPYEIIIGDDLSTDKTKNIQKYFPNIHVNKNLSDHGFLMNCNRAAKLAKGKYILFLNNDTQVQENWLSSLVELIERDPKIGMVGSKLVYPNGKLQEAGGIIWSDASGWNYGRNQDPEMPEYNYVKEADYISGASIMIRASLWNEIGGFDERYKPAYYEDSDLAFEVRRHGYKVMYQPASVVVHFEGVSNGTDLNSGLKKYQVENKEKFVSKWAEDLKKQCPPESEKYLFKARDRSFGKKVILVIDHYVPTFDKDAGSKTTYQYIKMFLAKEYSVKFVGDNYAFREMEPYMSALLQLGVEVLYGSWFANHIFEWIQSNKAHIDVAYLNRPHITMKYIDFIKRNTGIKVIYYGHDLHFLRMKRESELTGNDNLRAEAELWKTREFEIMKKSDVVYYPSYIEKDAIKAMAPEINVKAIHAYVFDVDKRKNIYSAEKRDGIMFVGGFTHTPNVDAVKWFVNDVFPKIRMKNESIKFYIVGSNAPDEIKKMNGNGVVFKGFVSEGALKELYANCRIVVVPLRYGAGVKGKVIEALYNCVPVVTTTIGAEGIDGIESVAKIQDSECDFAKAVLDLYEDKEQLNRMGKAAAEFIKENFSMDAAWNVIKEDF